MLVPILRARTPSTVIDGETIMEDFTAKMKEKVDGDIPYDNAFVLEMQEQEKLLNDYEMTSALKLTRYTYRR
jgi:hypothetical protein